MVAQGWALAYRQFSDDYVAQEGKAREARLGMWRGEFVAPWDWRRGDRLAAVPAGKPAAFFHGRTMSENRRITD